MKCRGVWGSGQTSRRIRRATRGHCSPSLLLALLLFGCGDLPRPFAGNPGRNALALSVPPPPRLLVPAPTDGLLPAPDAAVWAQAVTDALVADEIPAFAMPPHKGEWLLRLSASLQGDQVTPAFHAVRSERWHQRRCLRQARRSLALGGGVETRVSAKRDAGGPANRGSAALGGCDAEAERSEQPV